MDFKKTLFADNLKGNSNSIKNILDTVLKALDEKGYNSQTQISGYILSGDPTYITSHKKARSLITKIDREELIEFLVKEYIKENR